MIELCPCHGCRISRGQEWDADFSAEQRAAWDERRSWSTLVVPGDTIWINHNGGGSHRYLHPQLWNPPESTVPLTT